MGKRFLFIFLLILVLLSTSCAGFGYTRKGPLWNVLTHGETRRECQIKGAVWFIMIVGAIIYLVHRMDKMPPTDLGLAFVKGSLVYFADLEHGKDRDGPFIEILLLNGDTVKLRGYASQRLGKIVPPSSLIHRYPKEYRE